MSGCCSHCLSMYNIFDSVLQNGLYPTVGLQTPGEVVEANFGQQSFVFDIHDYMQVCSELLKFCYKVDPEASLALSKDLRLTPN